MKKQECFEKRCGKYLFEKNRSLSIKTKEEISTTIIKKEITETSEEEIIKKLTENLNIGGHSEERIIISSTIVKSALKNIKGVGEDIKEVDINNIFDIKKHILSESFEQNFEKNNNIINKNENSDKMKSNTNIIFSQKNMIIIKSLIYLSKDDSAYNIENFRKRYPDLNKSKSEDDNKFEKNIYIRIEDRIREYLNKIKLDKLSQLKDIENMYINKLKDFSKKSEKYKYIVIKAIILGILNLINDLIGKEYLKLVDEQKNDEIKNGLFILEIYEKYEIMKKINIFIEKDFNIFINDFKEENDIEFNFMDLITDFFWDYVFRIKEINKFITNNYGSENINTKLNETFDKIVDILIKIEFPFRKIIGEMLDISCIKKEKFYLMDYILKYKGSSNKSLKKNSKEKTEDKSTKLDMPSSSNNISNKKENNQGGYIKNEQNDDDKEKNIIEKSEKEVKTKSDEINLPNLEINKSNLNVNLDIGKSYSENLSKNKTNDNSIDNLCNYILYGENNNENEKKKKKKHKKRKKNKNNGGIILSEEKEGLEDPVVDEFKNFINDLNSQKSKDYIKKIKPKIKQDWIDEEKN